MIKFSFYISLILLVNIKILKPTRPRKVIILLFDYKKVIYFITFESWRRPEH